MTTADWLQGPYLYRLYEEYGFLKEQIAVLYITGYITSMMIGPAAGGLADTFGRKRAAQACCVIYAVSCLTKVGMSTLSSSSANQYLFAVLAIMS